MHSGPGAPVVTYRWYFTNLPMIEGTTLINNRVFDSEPWKDRPVGELADEVKNWKQDGARPRPRGLHGRHLCHPEWFRTGEPWPTSLPDTHYNADGIPLCCGVLVDDAAVPVVVTVTAGESGPWVIAAAVPVAVTVLAGDTTPGGEPARVSVALSVTAGESGPWVDAAAVPVAVTVTAGDMTPGGELSVVPVAVTVTAGDVTPGGELSVVPVAVTVTAGDTTAGGEPARVSVAVSVTAGESGPWVDAAAVPVAVTVTAGESGPWVIAASVPVAVTVTAGEYGPWVVGAVVPVAVTVTAGESGPWVDAAPVPVAVTIDAGEDISGSTPPPGASCSAATVIDVDTDYAWTAPTVGSEQQWWKLPVAVYSSFVIWTTGINAVAVQCEVSYGPNCGSRVVVWSIYDSPTNVNVDPDFMWLKVTSPSGAGTAFTFRIEFM